MTDPSMQKEKDIVKDLEHSVHSIVERYKLERSMGVQYQIQYADCLDLRVRHCIPDGYHKIFIISLERPLPKIEIERRLNEVFKDGKNGKTS